MPTVTKTPMGEMVEQITITLEKEDYLPRYREELEQVRQKLNMKGFRKGRIPLNLVSRMYGKGVLGEVVSQLLGEELDQVIRGEDGGISYLGRPIPIGEQPDFSKATAAQESHSMTFELGRAPSFDLAGMDESTVYTIFDVEVSAEAVRETMERMIREYNTMEPHEGPIAEEDMLRLSVKELDGDAVKEGGVESTCSVAVDKLASEALKSEVLRLSKGDGFRCNIYELEAGQSPEQVNKYLLGLSEDALEAPDSRVGPHFQATIEEVSRLTPPEMTEDLWSEIFGPDIRTEESAMAEVSRWLKEQENNRVDYLFMEEFRERVLSLNREAMPLPGEFLLRWIQQENEEEARKASADPAAFQEDIRWSIIRSRLVHEYGIEVTEKEIREQAVNRVASMMGGYSNPEFLSKLVQNLLSNKEQVDSIASGVEYSKLVRELQSRLTLERTPITQEALREKYDTVRQRHLPSDESQAVEDIEVTSEEIVAD
ncbi:MAG: hypothetical protein RLY31_2245 [Bacteroidota bacterium]|jgi:trigger factor